MQQPVPTLWDFLRVGVYWEQNPSPASGLRDSLAHLGSACRTVHVIEERRTSARMTSARNARMTSARM
eukprot:2457518-Pyramimonas_sp.AAC.1